MVESGLVSCHRRAIGCKSALLFGEPQANKKTRIQERDLGMAFGFVLPIIGIVVGIALLILQRRKVRGAASLVVFSLALIIWACAYGMLRYTSIYQPQSDGRFWLALLTLGATVTSTALLTFIIAYTNHTEWLGKWGILLLCVEPLSTQVLIWTNRWQDYFSTTYRLTNTGLLLNPSPWYWINASYSDGLMILALILLTQTFLNKPRQYMLQSITIIIGVFIPILTKVVSLAAFVFLLNLEPPLAAFVIAGGLLVYSIFRYKLIDIIPIARDTVVERMSEGWMTLDLNNRIVDLNPAAEKLLGVTREQTFGKPAEDFLQNLLDLGQDPSVREPELRGSVVVNGELRYLSVRVLPLIRPPEKQVGKVVLWRDIAERRKADNARQLARDEMFVLLHSISDTAFRTLNQNDFLTTSISQIVYAFRSQAGLIYLLEEAGVQAAPPRLYLAAHHGMARHELEHLSGSPEVSRFVTHIFEQQEPFLSPDICTDMRFPPAMQQSGNKSMLMLPLMAGEHALGVIGLVKKEDGPGFGNGGTTRLAIVAEELASFIRNDRKRKQALAQEERRSLGNDLHDSISQKLYALVQQTEAAQARLETGSTVTADDLARIGESARQTLKEMRLFIYQMKPVDLENKGLVAALNERLAAVEGRANMKARVLPDDNIYLSLEKETVLYNIAMEALNNIMKYANAKSVTILLKKRKAAVILEVVDDGCGFDTKKPGNGGTGLRIMQERLAKVDGKLTIRSAPGKGTKVIATVDENRVPRTTRMKRKL
jgi:PAS domain S-box-containing protein